MKTKAVYKVLLAYKRIGNEVFLLVTEACSKRDVREVLKTAPELESLSEYVLESLSMIELLRVLTCVFHLESPEDDKIREEMINIMNTILQEKKEFEQKIIFVSEKQVEAFLIRLKAQFQEVLLQGHEISGQIEKQLENESEIQLKGWLRKLILFTERMLDKEFQALYKYIP